jgi:hypothetical protein
MVACNLQLPPANGKQGPTAPTNKKQDKFDKVHADNIAKCSGVSIYREKYKNIFFRGGASEKS